MSKQKSEFNDIFTDTLSLAECKKKCDRVVGCEAISYLKGRGTSIGGVGSCYGTSDYARTTAENDWMCFSKPGQQILLETNLEYISNNFGNNIENMDLYLL